MRIWSMVGGCIVWIVMRSFVRCRAFEVAMFVRTTVWWGKVIRRAVLEITSELRLLVIGSVLKYNIVRLLMGLGFDLASCLVVLLLSHSLWLHVVGRFVVLESVGTLGLIRMLVTITMRLVIVLLRTVLELVAMLVFALVVTLVMHWLFLKSGSMSIPMTLVATGRHRLPSSVLPWHGRGRTVGLSEAEQSSQEP